MALNATGTHHVHVFVTCEGQSRTGGTRAFVGRRVQGRVPAVPALAAAVPVFRALLRLFGDEIDYETVD
jgi:hypothetical protein